MPEVYKLSDYRPLDFWVAQIDLELDLTKEPVQSRAVLSIERNPDSSSWSTDLELDCENMILTSILLNDRALSAEEYELKENSLIIKNIPNSRHFSLKTTSLLGANTDLFGLYKTEGTILVKAETEGLRRVFPCKDRPDNLATYAVTIIARKDEYPTLLSNGLLAEKKDLGNGIHSVVWVDVIPKPSYLFAMVAGKLKCTQTSYITRNNRMLPIKFYVPEDAVEKCVFAKEVLKESMKWDEERFGLECALPEYKVAGVNKYASGASEPLGLNLFNTANLYATSASRTDSDILRVLDVVSHEFFHTWTGDFVTIRDWFNLSAKEGLTTFRASLFMEHWLGVDLDRMFDGRSLDERAPRPDSYTAVRSLYTTAAYEKSAEIFRMIMNRLGEKEFDKNLTTFLKANVGKAVTLENILDSFSNQSRKDLHPFLNWFTQSGTPKVTVINEYIPQEKSYKLKFITLEGKGRPIPINIMLFNNQGQAITEEIPLIIDQPETVIEYPNVSECPTPSLLRGFSAPINLEFKYSNEQLLLLMQFDEDIYNKCKSAKILITRMIESYCANSTIEFSPQFIEAYRNILNESKLQTWVLSELLALPSIEALITSLPKIDFETIATGRLLIQKKLAQELKSELQQTINKLDAPSKPDSKLLFDIHAAGNRRLKALCYSYLLTIEPIRIEQDLIAQFNKALGKNMTETISALMLLAELNCPQLDSLLERFYNHWQHDIDAVNYWFNLQASTHSSHLVQKIEQLMQHPAFDLSNPNKVYALLGTFIRNPYGFHALSGDGYQLITTVILALEQINPTMAANLTEKFNEWDKLDIKRQNLMLASLANIYNKAITSDVRNMAKKGLEKAGINLDSIPSQTVKLPVDIMFLGNGTKIKEQTNSLLEQATTQLN